MIRTQVSFEEELYREAQRAARRRGTSLAELCRRGLRRVLADSNEAAKYMDLIGSLASGDAGASESVDQFVYGRHEP